MYPIIIIAGHKIGTYALFGIVGILVSATFASLKLKKSNIRAEDVITYTLFCTLGALVGGHFLYGLVNFKLIKKAFTVLFLEKNLKKSFLGFMSAFGGSVYYGCFFGIVVTLWCILRKNVNKSIIFDTTAEAIPLFHAFGRLGCFFGGCCYGIESSVGFTVYHNEFVPDICFVSRFPVAILEAVLNMFIFLALVRISENKKTAGNLLLYYGAMYSVVRFITEFLRGDRIRGIYFGLSTSQWISIGLFVVSITTMIIKRQKHFKPE